MRIFDDDDDDDEIPYNSENKPRAYIFQRPFLRGLFLEGLIFGGANKRREVCVSKSARLILGGKSIGLAYS